MLKAFAFGATRIAPLKSESWLKPSKFGSKHWRLQLNTPELNGTLAHMILNTVWVWIIS